MLLCYLLGRSTNTIESNTKALFDASTEEVLETNAKETKYIQWQYQQMHTSILKLVYIHNDLLHVSAKHKAIFREVKYKGSIH